MKKFIECLSSPEVNMILGLMLYLWLGCCFWLYDSFDRKSAFYGGLFVIALDIFSYGFNSLCDRRKSKKVSLESK